MFKIDGGPPNKSSDDALFLGDGLMLKHWMIGASALALVACGGNESAPTEPSGPSQPETEASSPPSAGSMLYSGGTIYTGNPDLPVARSVIVNTSGVITSVSADDMDAAANLETVDLAGATMFPGFVDGHAHLLGIGQRELSFDLTGTASLTELLTHLEAEMQGRATGELVIGRGWIETGWEEGRTPNAADLDTQSPDNPVILVRADGHALVANTAALAAAGITNETPDPDGGKIERGPDGAATGILIDNAMGLALGLMEEPSKADISKALETGAAVYASRGWTGVHNMSVAPKEAPIMASLDGSGKMPIRLHNAFNTGGFPLAEDRRYETDTIQNRAVKVYMDGALGSRGAQLLEPYSDRPDTSGLSLLAPESLLGIMAEADRKGVQLAIHAIGDRANRNILIAFEDDDYTKEHRWRIEHTQILDAADVERMAKSGLIASMQPSHAIGDLHFAPDRLGMDRLVGAYAWRDLLDAGAVIVGGSDAPVEIGSPLIEFYAAVARKDLQGFSGEGWHPEQAVTREEALAMFTSAPAYASFQEDVLGTIEVGKLADFTVFDRDLMTVAEADILEAKPVMTVVNGEIVWRAQ